MLWVGERTRQLTGAHCEFLSGINNPVGSKVGPDATPDEVIGLCERLNPNRVPGRLTLITRLGVDGVDTALPPLLRAVRDEGHPWSGCAIPCTATPSPPGRPEDP